MKLLPTLLLAAALTMGCAGGITKDGLFVSIGDSSMKSHETESKGGRISQTFGTVIEGVVAMLPFAKPNPEVTVNVEQPAADESL